MTFRLTLVALLALGCAGRDLSAYVQDTEETRAVRAYAADVWATAGVSTPKDYALGLLPVAELQDACEVPSGDPLVHGCTFLDERVILLDEALAADGSIHELGHLTRGTGGHLQCDKHGRGPDVMCPGGQSQPRVGPTARDIAFARGR